MPLPLSLTKFIECIPDPIVISNTGGRVLAYNQLFVKKLRATQSDEGLLGRNILDFIAKRSIDTARSFLETAINGIPVEGCACTLTRDDGSDFPAEVSIKTMTEEGDLYVISIFKDVSGRAKAEEQLKESEVKFRTVADFTYDWEYWRSPEGGILYCSPSCERITGYPPNDFIDNPDLIVTIVYPEDRPLFINHLNSLGSRDSAFDFRIVTYTGEVRWISHVCQNVVGADGRSMGRRVSNRDISEHKKIEETKAESEARLKMLFESAPAACFINDLEGRIMDLNLAAERLSGFSREELIGKNLWEIWLIPKDQQRKASSIYLKCANGEPSYNEESTLTKKDGSVIDVEVTVHPVRMGDDVLVFGSLTDITARKATEKALKGSEAKYRGIFSASHDALFLINGESGAIIDANESAIKLYGYGIDELLKLRNTDLTEDPEVILQLIKRKARVVPFIYNQKKDGTVFPAEVSLSYPSQQEGKLVILCVRDITERVRTELDLIKNELLYRTIVEDQTDLIDRFLPNGKSIIANRAYRKYFGDVETNGGNIFSHIPPKERGQLRRQIASLTPQNPVGINENQVITQYGQMRWVQWANRGIFDEKGTLVEVQCVGRDLTDLKQIELALIESERNYRELVENANSIISKLDAEGKILSFNEYAERFFGYSREEVIGKTVYENIVPKIESSGRDLSNLVNDIFTNEEAFCNNVNENIKKNGERVWVQWTNKPIKDKDGKLTAILSVGTDVTERKKIERALAESEAKFRAAFSQAYVAMVMLSTEGTFINVNDAYCKMLGYSHEELRGKCPTDFTHPADVELTRQCIEEGINSQAVTQHYEKRYIKKDGEILWALIDNIAVTDEKGKVLYLFGIIRDITKRKDAEERLRLQTRVLESVNLILEETVSSENEEQLGKKVLDIICDLTGSQFGFMGEIDYDSKLKNIIINENGWNECKIPAERARMLLKNVSLTGAHKAIMDSRKLIVMNDLQNSAYGSGIPEGHPVIRSFLGFPVMVKNDIIGFIGLANKKEKRYTEKDIQVAEMLSTPIAEAISRFRIKNMLSEQRALQKSEERFRGIAERSYDTIVTTDLEGRITYCSPAIEKMLGFGAEEILSKSILDLKWYSKKENILQAFARLRQGKQEFFTFHTTKKDGNEVYIEGNAHPIFKNKEIVGYQAILRDISAKIKAQKDLERSEEKYRELFVTTPVGILDIDLQDILSPITQNGRIDQNKLKEFIEKPESISKFLSSLKIENANQAAFKLLGVGNLDQFTSAFYAFFSNPRPERAALIKTLSDKYVDLLNGKEVDIETITIEGKKIMLSIRASVFSLGEKRPRAIICLNDTTERYELDKMKDQFISSITHELRTPLLSVVGYLQLLMSGSIGSVPEEIMPHLEIVMRNSLRLKNLTDDLLDLSRIDAGKLSLTIETVNLKEVINQCVIDANHILSEKMHPIHVSVPDAPIFIQCDRIRLVQIMMNLLSNAIKYSPNGGQIMINASANGENLKVEVADEGIGIRQDDLKKIFDRFATILKPIYAKGTGLGLSVTRELVEAHGGKIWAESAGEDKGSTFIFILPLNQKC